jgi:hypothetical protein
MKKTSAAAILLWLGLYGRAVAQAPAPAPTAAPAATAATASAETAAGRPAAPLGAPLKITEAGTTLVARFPTDNPFGSAVDSPAMPPVKPVIPKILMTDEMYVAIRVDAKGKSTSFKRVRDPIPSIGADTQKSFLRWVFDPPKKGGQPVDTWTSVKLDLAMEVDPLKIEVLQLTPVTREAPIPTPFEWPAAAAWFEAQKPAPPTDGAVPLEQLDVPPAPRKTPWSADSFNRSITVKLLVRITAAGKVDRMVPLQVADPFLIPYLKKGLALLVFKPARVGNANIDSWNEALLTGTIDTSIELKQILSLRKSLAGNQ